MNSIKIRQANLNDCKSLFDWRSDELSRTMSFNGSSSSIEEHEVWFKNSLCNVDRALYIGELGDKKLGVCRFDFLESEQLAEVSINMNPSMRGCGLGKKFLFESIEFYLEKNGYNLLAKVKPNNLASLNIFESAGFESFASDESMIVLRRDFKEVAFKEVNDQDAKVLLKLLESRDYPISHHNPPTKEDHLLFVKSKPYRYWAIVLEDNLPVGTVYIQSNNSIGLNLLQQKKQLVHKILRHIKTSLNPLKEVKSKAPPYFYINISYANNKLGKILCELDASPIQVSYKI
jgi:RimJ/RimL family protein N-acetyltransferase